ncbi:helix-turn-helix domain-containing protein [uncultured Amnibacterium sp.]|uniref:helix-turn-helix domain-containing protein n=1 Tax=uncultured Amnibacterium sp. TaxID=1631851 RepID=UPI0035CA07D6
MESLLRLQYSAGDPVAATGAMRSIIGTAQVSARGDAFTWEQVSLVDDGITVTSIHSRGDNVRVHISGASELLVALVQAGEVVLSTGGMKARLGPQGLGLIPISADAELRWSSARLQFLAVPAAPLARLLGVPRTAVRLHAPRIAPCAPELAEYLRRIAHTLTSAAFGTPAVYDRDLIRAGTIDLFAAVIIETFELTNRSEDAADRDTTVIRRAIAEMRARLTEPITIPEVAEAAAVSVRGLQMAFVRTLGVPPLLHLRQLRLEAARAALVEEAKVGTTIADIARRFGYANSGRFSTHYRNEYGEAPSATLQRIRGFEAPVSTPAPDADPGADFARAEARYGTPGTPGPDGVTGATAASS